MSILAETQPSRQGYISAVTLLGAGSIPHQAGEVQPAFFHLQTISGFKLIRGGGLWLDCRFEYSKPRGGRYQLEAACQFDHLAKTTGGSYIRQCSCPDGLARAGQRGPQRHCKHMVALAARIAASAGRSAGAELGESIQQNYPKAKDVTWGIACSSGPQSYDDQIGAQMEDERAAGACE